MKTDTVKTKLRRT